MPIARLKGLAVAMCCAVLVSMVPISSVNAASDPPINPEELYFPINNMNIPILQNGKTQGTLLFNFLIELEKPGERSIMVRYAPKIKSVFFDELYKFAATLKADEKVNLGEIKTMLTEVAKKIAGERRVKQVLVKDYRRAFAR
tara:strand:+ start:140 stop:568 length:429 start_codon:yes stop_codon:yes gene_type:complete